MENLSLSLNRKKSEIMIREGILSEIGKDLFIKISSKKIFVISDRNILGIYQNMILESLIPYHQRVEIIDIIPGEKSKNFFEVNRVCSRLFELGMKRGDVIIAFGGGVIGDLAGFIASIIFRGVMLVQIPTTLLAQVDSSVGGKVGIDTDYGKNLIGSFYQPSFVYVDPNFLKTLEKRHILNGMAEVIKYGIIYDKIFFEKIELLDINSIPFCIDEIIERCLQLKTKAVEKDEYDVGERMMLNFGHSLGHALEKYYQYNHLLHGEAISIGMVWAAKMSVYFGYLSHKELERIKRVLLKFGLPIHSDVNFIDLFETMISDKKNLNDNFTLIFIKEIGSSIKVELQKSEVLNANQN